MVCKYCNEKILEGEKVHRHHIDENMKRENPRRYWLFLEEDIVILHRSCHISFHARKQQWNETRRDNNAKAHKGKKRADAEKSAISAGCRGKKKNFWNIDEDGNEVWSKKIPDGFKRNHKRSNGVLGKGNKKRARISWADYVKTIKEGAA